jgi:ABC-2 type transport system permease protein
MVLVMAMNDDGEPLNEPPNPPAASSGLPERNQASRAAVFLACARIGFLRMLAYRTRYIVGIANYLLYVGVAYYLWEAVFIARGAAGDIAGFALGDTVTYIAIGWVVRAAYFNNADQVIANRFVGGDISLDLARPTSLYLLYYGDAVGEGLFRTGVMAVPICVLLMVLFPVGMPASPTHAVLFIVSSMMAFHLFFCVNFLTGLLALHFENLAGFMWAKFNLLLLLSGVLFPLEFLPQGVQVAMEWLPFKHIGHTPVVIYLDKAHESLWLLLAKQVAWGLLLMYLCGRGWRRAQNSLAIQGG